MERFQHLLSTPTCACTPRAMVVWARWMRCSKCFSQTSERVGVLGGGCVRTCTSTSSVFLFIYQTQEHENTASVHPERLTPFVMLPNTARKGVATLRSTSQLPSPPLAPPPRVHGGWLSAPRRGVRDGPNAVGPHRFGASTLARLVRRQSGRADAATARPTAAAASSAMDE
jgi:hypothetical protein